MDWTEAEKSTLLNNVLEMVGDKFSYVVSKSKVQWDKLVEGRDGKDCETMFKILTGKVRRQRLFSEIIEDARTEMRKGWSVKFCEDNFPDFPKRPQNTMAMYYNDHKDEWKDLEFKNMISFMTQKWRDCPEEEKEAYKNKYFKKKKRYYKKLEQFKQNHPNVIVQSQTQLKIPAPVVQTPLGMYIKHVWAKMQAKYPELDSKQLRKKCSSKYQKLSDNKKLKWILQAKDSLSDYKDQCEVYKQQKPDAKLKPAVVPLNRDEHKILDKHEGKPTAPPNNLFLFFCQRNKVDPKLSLSARSKQLSQSYHALSEEELMELKKSYIEVLGTYMNDFTGFYETLPPERKLMEEETFKGLTFYEKLVSSTKKRSKRKLKEEKEPSKKKSKSDDDLAAKGKEMQNVDNFDALLSFSTPFAASKQQKTTGESESSDEAETNTNAMNNESDGSLEAFSAPLTFKKKQAVRKGFGAQKGEKGAEEANLSVQEETPRKSKKKKKHMKKKE